MGNERKTSRIESQIKRSRNRARKEWIKCQLKNVRNQRGRNGRGRKIAVTDK